MNYTVRYAHLASIAVKFGSIVKEGDSIGVMGNTGQSTGAHLHIDCVRGLQHNRYTLADIENEKYRSEIKQLNYFIDDGLFKAKPRITTYYGEPEYMSLFGKIHHGYDVVPETGDRKIFWNRSKIGTVTAIFENDAGYGNMVMVTYDA